MPAAALFNGLDQIGTDWASFHDVAERLMFEATVSRVVDAMPRVMRRRARS
jgi:hypothetical protein